MIIFHCCTFIACASRIVFDLRKKKPSCVFAQKRSSVNIWPLCAARSKTRSMSTFDFTRLLKTHPKVSLQLLAWYYYNKCFMTLIQCKTGKQNLWFAGPSLNFLLLTPSSRYAKIALEDWTQQQNSSFLSDIQASMFWYHPYIREGVTIKWLNNMRSPWSMHIKNWT